MHSPAHIQKASDSRSSRVRKRPLIQADLEVGKPGDKYEQEADAVAQRVMMQPSMDEEEAVQMEVADEEEEMVQMEPADEEEEIVQMAAVDQEQAVQMQAEEEESVQMEMAIEEEEMAQMQSAGEEEEMVAMESMAKEDESLQMASAEEETEALQMQAEDEEEVIQQSPAPVLQCDGGGGRKASAGLASRINLAKGSGDSMESGIQREMEHKIGADFSGVKIHTGSASVQMSRELGAKAFTVGNDIHFNRGQYDPHSSKGKRLLAHELTHVVQQNGTGRISMLPGRVQLMSPKVIQRRHGETDVVWARSKSESIKRVQRVTRNVVDILTLDAKYAIENIESVKDAYEKFEKNYNSAVKRVMNGISSARAQEEQLKSGITAALDLALFAAGGPWIRAASAGIRAARAIGNVKKYVDAVGKIGDVAGVAAPPKPDSLSELPLRPDNIDWAQAMDVTLSIFKKTLKGVRQLNGIGQRCDNHLNFLANVRDGTYEGTNPRESRHGKSAAAMADNSNEIVRLLLGSFYPGVVSFPAIAFHAMTVTPLKGKTIRDLEQEITIRWIAGLSWSQLGTFTGGEVGAAKKYLRQIGLIDEGENRLNFSSGWTGVTDAGAKVIRLLARNEVAAMSMVGTIANWQGNFGVQIRGGLVTGLVSHRRYTGLWNATAPESSALERGDQVKIESYDVSRSKRTKWTSYGRSEREKIQSEVTLRVRPV